MMKIQMFVHKLVRPVQNVEGATAIEYGLIAALISVAAVGIWGTVGENLVTAFTTVANNLVP